MQSPATRCSRTRWKPTSAWRISPGASFGAWRSRLNAIRKCYHAEQSGRAGATRASERDFVAPALVSEHGRAAVDLLENEAGGQLVAFVEDLAVDHDHAAGGVARVTG